MKFAVLSLAAAAGLALSADTASAQWRAGQQRHGYSVITPGVGFQSGNFGHFSRPGLTTTADYGNGIRYSGVANVYSNPTTYSPLWTPSATNLHYGVPYYGYGSSYGYGQPSFYHGNAFGGYRWRW